MPDHIHAWIELIPVVKNRFADYKLYWNLWNNYESLEKKFIDHFFILQGDDGKVFIWDVRSRNGDCILRLDRIGCEVNQVRFFPTGNSVGYTTADGKVTSNNSFCLAR